MKILVVEDEPGPREGLVRLLSQSSPDWQLLVPAKNGIEGMAAAVEHRPDLVITDIRMPDGDGLEMVARLRSLGRRPEVVVLSGFSDFEYARKCISLGVKEYLVKPVTAVGLVDLVRQIERDHREDEELLLALEGRVRVAGVGALLLVRTAHPMDPGTRTLLRRETARLSGNPEGTLYAERPGEGVFLWVRGCPSIPANEVRRLQEHLAVLWRAAVVVAATWIDNGDLATGAQVLEQRVRGALVDPATDERPAGAEVEYSLSKEKELLAAVTSPETGLLTGLLEGWFQDTFRPGFSAASAVDAAKKLVVALQNRLKDLDKRRFLLLSTHHPLARLDACVHRDDVRLWFQSLATLLVEGSGAAPVSGDPRVQTVLGLVRDRLAHPPSLVECAELVNLSPEHLSRLFRQEVGEGFARYVMVQRVEKAKAALAEANQGIEGVCRQLGFGNTKYFFAVFRKVTGLTPSEYRDRSR